MDFIAQPFGVLMEYIYNFLAFENYGLAIIIFTIIARLILFPLNLSQQRNMDKQQALMPEIEALKKRYGNDQQKLQEEQQRLFAKYNVNPMAGCLPMLLQFPILMALYQIVQHPEYYIAGISKGDFIFLKIFDLKEVPRWDVWNFSGNEFSKYLPLLIFPLAAFATTYISQMMSMKKKKSKKDDDKEVKSPMTGMMKFMPFMTLIFGFIVPAGLALYWAVGNVLSILQTYLIRNVFTKKKEGSVKDA